MKYYSYRIDVRRDVSPTVGACSIFVNPVVPLYNASNMGIPYPTTSIQQQLWDSMQQQEVPIGFQGDDSSIGIVACSGRNVMGLIPRDVYPLGQEHASRTFLLSFMPTELTKEDLRQELEIQRKRKREMKLRMTIDFGYGEGNFSHKLKILGMPMVFWLIN